MEFLNDTFAYLQIFVLLNAAVAIMVVFFLGYRYYKSLRPLSEGISALSENRKIHLTEKGVASSLAAQILLLTTAGCMITIFGGVFILKSLSFI